MLPVLALLLLASSLWALVPVVYRSDSGTAIAETAEVRSLLFGVAAAADAAQGSEDRGSLDSAVAELLSRWQSLADGIDATLGTDTEAPLRAELDTAIRGFMVAATDYSEGAGDAAAASISFGEATAATDRLADALTASAGAQQANVRALEVGGSLLLIVAAFVAALAASRWRAGVWKQSHLDATTGLPDRAAFAGWLRDEIDRVAGTSFPATVLFINLDRFQMFNESLGHRGGDALLAAVAERLSGTLPRGHLLARFGGDEFLVLIPAALGLRPADVEEPLQGAFSALFQISGETLHLTATVGAGSVDGTISAPELIVRQAQYAMAHSKRAGSGGFAVYGPELDHDHPDLLRLESELRHAIERDQFVLHYQPFIRARDGKTEAFEALLRWEHPQRGLVAPGEFIPALEQSDLIFAAGAWVLRTACSQMSTWAEEGLGPFRVAVNVSARQFVEPGFVDSVREVLLESRLPPHLLEIEITESTAMEQVDLVSVVLADLRRLGVRLSLDDFGQGHSSFARLQRFPLSTVKIDRDFILAISQSHTRRSVVAGIIELAHSLQLEVVAEGIETTEQLTTLRELGCDLLQGYLLSRPLPPAALREWLLERETSPAQSIGTQSALAMTEVHTQLPQPGPEEQEDPRVRAS